MRHRRIVAAVVLALIADLAGLGPALRADADSYQRISGEGSSWAANAIDQMIVNVKQFGIVVDYNPTGSTTGRRDYINGTVDFAASDIPFQFHPDDGSAPENPKAGSYAYMPITAGGTSFMYNLKINGQRVTNLRLSGENVAKIFTGVITNWSDPALAKDNPGLNLPNRPVVPVVRSDGSGSTALLTQWMISQYPALWNDYCKRSGRAPACGFTSNYPTIKGMIAQPGDDGVSAYVAANYAEGAIGYVNYSYALNQQFPVAKVLNVAGYYTEPTPQNVAVSLLKADINTDASSQDYLTQKLDQVYVDPDPRTYELSSYSYLILPTQLPDPGKGQFNAAKGKTLGAFSYYAMCQAQQQSASLGYSPMPVNLVQASFQQIRKIPGVVVQDISIQSCHNPTFSADGTNLLATQAPQPSACDKQGASQCTTGTGGAKAPTAVTGAGGASGGGGGGSGGAGSGPSSGGGSTGGGAGGNGIGAGGGGAPSDGSAPDASAGAGSTGAAACDADTGICDPSVSGTGATGTVAASRTSSQLAAASPTVLAASTGWSGQRLLLVLVVLLTVGLVIAPALAWSYLSEHG